MRTSENRQKIKRNKNRNQVHIQQIQTKKTIKLPIRHTINWVKDLK